MIQPSAESQFYGQVQAWPRIEAANVMDDGQTLAVLVREEDGTISAISIGIEQLAD